MLYKYTIVTLNTKAYTFNTHFLLNYFLLFQIKKLGTYYSYNYECCMFKIMKIYISKSQKIKKRNLTFLSEYFVFEKLTQPIATYVLGP